MSLKIEMLPFSFFIFQWFCFTYGVNANNTLHVLSYFELHSDSTLNELQKEKVLRLFSSVNTFGKDTSSILRFHLAVYYNSTEVLLSNTNGTDYTAYLSSKYSADLSAFKPSDQTLLMKFQDVGLFLSFIPIEELLVYDQRYQMNENRNDLLRLFSSFYLARKFLTGSFSFSGDHRKQTFDSSVYSDYIIFIDPSFFVASNRIFEYIHTITQKSRSEFHVLPFLPINQNFSPTNLEASLGVYDYYNKLFNLNLYYISLPLAIPSSFYVHSALLSNSMSISNILQSAIQSLTKTGITLIHSQTDEMNIIYARRSYETPYSYSAPTQSMGELEEIHSIALIEIDEDNHKLSILSNLCTIQLHIEWAFVNTVSIIQKFLHYHFQENEKKLREFSFCEKVCFNENCPAATASAGGRKNIKRENDLQELLSYYPPEITSDYFKKSDFIFNEFVSFRQDYLGKDLHLKTSSSKLMFNKAKTNENPQSFLLANGQRVFDCILFFNELSLLRLRLSLMSPYITKHIIVESRYTFTGKPKKVTLLSNDAQKLLKEFSHKIEIVILDSLPNQPPQTVGDIWQNEYYSRNYFHQVLTDKYMIQPQDLIIIADTDEIVDPEILLSLYAVFDYSFYQHRQELQQQTNENTKTRTVLPFIRTTDFYKLMLTEYLYDFDCYINTVFSYFPSSGPSTVITTWAKSMEIARQLLITTSNYDRAVLSNKNSDFPGKENNFILSRNYLQYYPILPYQYVVSNYVWHLSFFHQGNFQSTKEKLESYSHQNFARQFFETNGSEEDKKTYTNKDLVPQGNISLKLIENRIRSKKLINGKEFKSKYKRNRIHIDKRASSEGDAETGEDGEILGCQEQRFEMKTMILRRLWEKINLEHSGKS
jgi:hypothetical protein